MMAQVTMVASREEAISRMRGAAERNLRETHTAAERKAWAEAKVEEYLRAGVLRIEAVR